MQTDYFKTPILQEILRIQYLLLEEPFAFFEVIHLSQYSFTQFKKIRDHLFGRWIEI